MMEPCERHVGVGFVMDCEACQFIDRASRIKGVAIIRKDDGLEIEVHGSIMNPALLRALLEGHEVVPSLRTVQ